MKRVYVAHACFALAVAAMASCGSADTIARSGPLAPDLTAPVWQEARYVFRWCGGSGVHLKWSCVRGATEYRISRRSGEVSTVNPPAGANSCEYVDYVGAGDHHYTVQAVFGSATGPVSEVRTVQVGIVDWVEQVPPTWKQAVLDPEIRAGVSRPRVRLSWHKNAEIAFNIYRSTTPGRDFRLLTSTSEEFFVDDTVDPNTKTYYYIIAGVDSVFCESRPSSEYSIAIGPSE